MNQTVVFRYNDRALVGQVYEIKTIGKATVYDVLCEDGKVYSDLKVDTVANECIDTRYTRLFYLKYKIDENSIPEHDSVEHITADAIEPETVQEVLEPVIVDGDDDIIEIEDRDLNW